MFLDILKIIIISVVEGITEFIPVSSTGHILIVEGLLKPFSNEQFRNSFAFVIQLGAIMSVVFVYWKRIFPFIGTAEEQKAKWNMWFKIFVAIIPAVFLIFPIMKMQGDKVSLDDLTEKFLYNPLPIAIALIVYGIILIVIENKNKGKKFNLIRFLLDPGFKFIQKYIFKLGILDGVEGFLLASIDMQYSLLKQYKLKKLGDKENLVK